MARREIPVSEWALMARAAPRARHLYLVQEGDDGPVKVGIARNAIWRVSSLRGGNPRTLNLRAVWEFPDRPSVLKAERDVQARFAGARLVGEWFNAAPEAIRDYVRGRYGA